MYNHQDTVENNLIKGTGFYVPGYMEEAQTMRFQVMSVLTACPHHVWTLGLTEHKCGCQTVGATAESG